MKIVSSDLSMQSRQSSFTRLHREESLKVWVGQARPDIEGNIGGILELSEEARALMEQGTKIEGTAPEDDGVFEISEEDKLKIAMIENMLQFITGKKIKIRVLDKLEGFKAKTGLNFSQPAPISPRRQGWGLEYNFHESYYEREKLSFSSQGIIKTADGREIDFSVQLNMSREFYSRQDISIRAGDAAAIDPLVINFDGAASELTSTKFSFDLDCDGNDDQISFVGRGSGFLALDLNEDGVINNGGELFGPGTGNGFSELALYDEDGNGWIDEGDTVFDRLRIWTKDESGKDTLFALAQKGIGAIYLGNINTPFSMKDQSNTLQAQMARTGIYLKEDGTVGTVHQLDLVI
ncbi:MAG: hypothetical protein ACOY46_13055 [Bacillota bacterium]